MTPPFPITTAAAAVPVTKPANPFAAFLESAADKIKDALGGDIKLVDIDGAIEFKGGKFLASFKETLLGKTLEQDFELDPAAAIHLAVNGIAGTAEKLFGKK